MSTVKGKYHLIQVSTDLVTPSWQLLGCQKDGELSRTSDSFEMTCKQGGAWADGSKSTKRWTLTGSGLYDEEHTFGYKQLRDAFDNDTPLLVRRVQVDELGAEESGTEAEGGTAEVTDLSNPFPEGDGSAYNVTFTGKGAPQTWDIP